LYEAEIRTLRKADQKYFESFEMGCWSRMQKIICSDCVRSEVLTQILGRDENPIE
jgi:hypothetical protein